MPKFRLRGDSALSLFAPENSKLSRLVNPGDIVEAPGELAGEQPEDAYMVGDGDDARAWPHALWELVADKPASKVKES